MYFMKIKLNGPKSSLRTRLRNISEIDHVYMPPWGRPTVAVKYVVKKMTYSYIWMNGDDEKKLTNHMLVNWNERGESGEDRPLRNMWLPRRSGGGMGAAKRLSRDSNEHHKLEKRRIQEDVWNRFEKNKEMWLVGQKKNIWGGRKAVKSLVVQRIMWHDEYMRWKEKKESVNRGMRYQMLHVVLGTRGGKLEDMGAVTKKCGEYYEQILMSEVGGQQ